jgi:hypothetical protein
VIWFLRLKSAVTRRHEGRLLPGLGAEGMRVCGKNSAPSKGIIASFDPKLRCSIGAG